MARLLELTLTAAAPTGSRTTCCCSTPAELSGSPHKTGCDGGSAALHVLVDTCHALLLTLRLRSRPVETGIVAQDGVFRVQRVP